ncbi:MAG: hypothetical protein RLZZ316_2486 [Bacteroidota bacterium]
MLCSRLPLLNNLIQYKGTMQLKLIVLLLMASPKIIFTVTNELIYDQRMIRICRSLANAGYRILLVGRKVKGAVSLKEEVFEQKRLSVFFNKGKFFYIEYNLRLFFFLLFNKATVIGAIDLDTILPVLFASKIKECKRVYDAHELFCEMKEVVSRPQIYRFWKRVERFAVPKFKEGYTVNQLIANEFTKMYGVNYNVIRSIALLREANTDAAPVEKYILYQGAVNEGRCFEFLIPAMQWVDLSLIICGEGNFFNETKALVEKYKLSNKVIFKGKLLPDDLRKVTANAFLGITLFDEKGLSNYYSLANRFFDYLHAGVPQLCSDYPAYREINNLYSIGVLTSNYEPKHLASIINNLLNDETLYQQLKTGCYKARQVYNWQQEEEKLLSFYKKIIPL